MWSRTRFLLTATLIGIVNALLLKSFEFLVNTGGGWLWNDVFRTDTSRWAVVPVAIVLGVLYTVLVRFLGQPRLVEPKTDPLDESGPTPSPTVKNIAVILAMGLGSLLAGASLGPEAPLVAAATVIGAYAALRLKSGAKGELLVLSSVGALMIAFLGSLILILLPVLVLYKKTKKLSLQALLPIGLAGVASFLTIQLIDHEHPGFGSINLVHSATTVDYVAAFMVGVLVALLAIILKGAIKRLFAVAMVVADRSHWAVAGTIFGAVIGLLYLAGGQTIEFNGSAGTNLLLERSATYSSLALVGLVCAKLIVTAWSMAAGYRGGLVFPSIYIGVATGLLLSSIFGELGGPGAMIGGIAGMFGAVTGSPLFGLLLIVAILPANLLGVAVAGIVGAYLGHLICAWFFAPPPHVETT